MEGWLKYTGRPLPIEKLGPLFGGKLAGLASAGPGPMKPAPSCEEVSLYAAGTTQQMALPPHSEKKQGCLPQGRKETPWLAGGGGSEHPSPPTSTSRFPGAPFFRSNNSFGAKEVFPARCCGGWGVPPPHRTPRALPVHPGPSSPPTVPKVRWMEQWTEEAHQLAVSSGVTIAQLRQAVADSAVRVREKFEDFLQFCRHAHRKKI